MNTYLFHRGDSGSAFFYTVDLQDDAEAIENAKHNPGTVQVTRADGEVVWPKPDHLN